MKLFSLIVVLLVAPVSVAQVVITEIMYNPASKEGGAVGKDKQKIQTRTEWVEVCNTGDKAVDMAGWVLKDDDGSTSALPDGASLAAGAVAVFVPDTLTAEQFAEAWGEGITVWPVSGWEKGGMRNLANSPKPGSEVVELLDAEGTSVDQVAYDDQGDWPSDGKGGNSIYLVADAMTAEANDIGTNWRKSEAEVDGAVEATITDVFDAADIGSPGSIPGANEPD